jgi:hypothetical protein
VKILIENEIFDRRPDKSKKPYWNPVREVGQVQCPNLDSLVYQTRYSGFDRTDTSDT